MGRAAATGRDSEAVEPGREWLPVSYYIWCSPSQPMPVPPDTIKREKPLSSLTTSRRERRLVSCAAPQKLPRLANLVVLKIYVIFLDHPAPFGKPSNSETYFCAPMVWAVAERRELNCFDLAMYS